MQKISIDKNYKPQVGDMLLYKAEIDSDGTESRPSFHPDVTYFIYKVYKNGAMDVVHTYENSTPIEQKFNILINENNCNYILAGFNKKYKDNIIALFADSKLTLKQIFDYASASAVYVLFDFGYRLNTKEMKTYKKLLRNKNIRFS